MPLKIEIVTPEGRVLERPADSVVIPTAMGEIGVLPGHIPLTALVEAGELRLTVVGEPEDAYVVGRGFALIENDRVSVLTDAAIETDNIDEQSVREACERAERSLAEKSEMDPAEVERLESVVRFAVAQLTVKKKR